MANPWLVAAAGFGKAKPMKKLGTKLIAKANMIVKMRCFIRLSFTKLSENARQAWP